MNSMTKLSSANIQNATERIFVIDALRGFSLFGIIITHCCYMYFKSIADPTSLVEYSNASNLDKLINTVVLTFVSGKFYIIFSLLFGLSFSIQMQSAQRKGKPFVTIFLWRLALLFLIGYMHALIFDGDILRIYAIFGTFLLLFISASNSTLLISSLILYIMSIFAVMFKPEVVAVVDPLMKQANTTFVFYFIDMDNIGFLIRSGRLFVTCALFLLGLYIGRNAIISYFSNNVMLQKNLILWTGIGSFLVTLLLGIFTFTNLKNFSFSESLSVIFISFQKVFLSCFYIAAFIYLFKISWTSRYLNWFVPVGKTGLTIYIMQSVFLTSLYRISSDKIISIGLLSMLGFTCVFYLFQILIAYIWVKYFQYGPIEWIWRSLIYFKIAPLLIAGPQRDAI